ncbi:hypothetical protein [Wohlfahrtiimonas chitiniclastica]|uniref:hypothetical protein n=1 Tax=Wohlfahrtiimonas chitiniclastica TaxID=400946 RepID=UPI001BCF1664|nr:hypothetical protein [Wohlfahrtiimonas chitiniclastica]MBS7837224.1 hypothetical protein [Wohlfahrtiimonas chitiniclastica]
MKRENKSSIFLSVMAAVISICAVLLLVVAVLILISVPKNQGAYDFIKDHGSLIAGLVGFLGIFFLVKSQRNTTKSLIRSDWLADAYKATILADNCVHRMRALSLKDKQDYHNCDQIYLDGILNISSMCTLVKKLSKRNVNMILKYRAIFIALHYLASLHVEVKAGIVGNPQTYIPMRLEQVRIMVEGSDMEDQILKCIDQYYRSPANHKETLILIFNSFIKMCTALIESNNDIVIMLDSISLDV